MDRFDSKFEQCRDLDKLSQPISGQGLGATVTTRPRYIVSLVQANGQMLMNQLTN